MKGACWTIVLAIASGLPIWFSGMRRLAQISVAEVLRHHVLALLASGLLAAILLPTRSLFGGLGGPLGALAWLVVGLLAWVGALLLLGRLTPWSVATEFQRLRAAARKKATDVAP
jgi:O-antigen/teichoic acid export membrane protein